MTIRYHSFHTVKYQFGINNAKVLDNAKIVFVPPQELPYLCLHLKN